MSAPAIWSGAIYAGVPVILAGCARLGCGHERLERVRVGAVHTGTIRCTDCGGSAVEPPGDAWSAR